MENFGSIQCMRMDSVKCFYLFSGIILGTFTMELGGKVNIECEKTGYRAELEFKLKVNTSHKDNNDNEHGLGNIEL